jgi:hypothetical protein
MSLLRTILFCATSCAVLAGSTFVAAAAPVNIIFDTDVDHDCDDIGALYILHGAAQRGDVKLLATLGCTSSDAIAPGSGCD